MTPMHRITLLRQVRPSLFHPSAHLVHLPPYAAMSTAPKAAETDAQAAAVASTTGVTASSLSATLKEKLGAQHVDIEDMSGGCGQMFQAIIVSPEFEKKNSLARHRLVNSTLKQEIAAIHAWTPKCFTPEEWEKKGGGAS